MAATARLLLPLAGAALLTFAPAAGAAERLAAGTLRVAAERGADCQARVLERGAAQRRVTAPSSGLLQARLSARSGDWDLALFDAAGRPLAGAAGFTATELAETWVRAGQRVVVQGCRRHSDARTARLRVTFTAMERTRRTEKIQLVRVPTPTDADKARLLATGLDVTEHGGENFLEVLTHSEADRARLRAAGFPFDVQIPDVAAEDRLARRSDAAFAAATDASALPSGRTEYRRLVDYEAEMKALVEQYPGLVKPLELPGVGRPGLPEPTLEGRVVHGIEITSNVNASDGKPVFLQTGVHHAREWPSSEHAMEWAYELVRNYGSDPRTTRLVDSVRTIVVPIVNVDGFNLSRESIVKGDTKHEYKRKNCRVADGQVPAPGACEAAAANRGVDPNRNYGGLWGGPGQSRSLTSETYSGAGPFSEPETRNIQTLVSRRQVGGLITNHTQGRLVLRPPGVKAQGPPKDEIVYKALGDRMAAHNGYASQWSYQLYDTTGTTEDWTYFATGGFGFTFEIGSGNFHTPYEQHVVGEWTGTTTTGNGGNREAYYEIMEIVADPEHHAVLEGRAPESRVLRLTKTFDTRTSDHGFENVAESFTDRLDTTMEVPEGGRFEWHVNPSTRPLVGGGHAPAGPTTADLDISEGAVPTLPNRGQTVQGQLPPQSYRDVPFTVAEGEDNGYVEVSIAPAAADADYDLVLLQKRLSDGAWVELSSSRRRGAGPEAVRSLHAGPGDYLVRVVNYNGAGGWSGEVRFLPPDPPETWTLTCETKRGRVVGRQEIVVDRGDRLRVDACR